MIIKGAGGVYRHEGTGSPPMLKMSGGEGRLPLRGERNQRTTKVAVDLIWRSGRWIVYEEARGVFRIDVVGEYMGFNGSVSRQEILRRFDEWAADDEARRNRRRDGGY